MTSRSFSSFLIIFFLFFSFSCYSPKQSGLPQPLASASKTTEVYTTAKGQLQTYALGSYSHIFTYAGQPVPTTYPNSITVLENTAYLVGYDEARENPAWVAYRIPAQTVSGNFPRPSRFQTDIRTRSRVSHDDYTKTGYDRGHMAPNLAIASHFGEQAQKETFLMSNVVPQLGELNQGPWRLLEETLSTITAPENDEIWVVTGPIYDKRPEYLKSGVEIPDAFFMVIADETPTGPRLQAFILPQTSSRRANFRNYLVSVDEVEKESGLNIFSELPDEQEGILEREISSYWLE